ncbi:MAG: hypothetical protein OXC31_16360, partial [Spirochaetaceae bacterium]|nr:hypothetical protein [Spirochaetaceae bacterium]
PRPPGRPFGMIALLVIVAVGAAAILWGRFVINPQPQVFLFDAGAAEHFAVGDPVWFPEVRIFVIAIDDDGERRMIRALDAIARGTGCTIELRPMIREAPRATRSAATGSTPTPARPACGRWAARRSTAPPRRCAPSASRARSPSTPRTAR